MSDLKGYVDSKDQDSNHDHLIRREIYSAERLEQYAENLAGEHFIEEKPSQNGLLEKRLSDNDQKLRDAYRTISKAMKDSSEMPPAAEWLVDNYFVLEEQIREIRHDLPPSYYRKLPKLASGPLSGYPRIYSIALAYTAHTDSFFNAGLLEKFIRSYQRRQPLNISELWAITITLRIALVENLRRAATLVIKDRKARSAADALADDLLERADAKDPKAIESGLKEVDRADLSSAFAVQLIQRLRDQDARVIPFLHRLDERLHLQGTSAEEVVRTEHQNQGALTITVRNIITSMRLISTYDWVEFFEKVSLVDDKLRAESPFAAMDLPTRNLYRRAIEKLAARSGQTEQAVAGEALRLAGRVRNAATGPEAVDLRKSNPGYYLIDKGRQELEGSIGYRPSWGDRIRRSPPAINFVIYMAANIFLVTCIIKLGLAGTVRHKDALWVLFVLSAAVFFPAWEAAITLINRLVIMAYAPSILPGLALREGIPEDCRTMVVVPVLFGSKADVITHVNQLHIHYLSNADGDVRFALLSDWKDADREVMPQDAEWLQLAHDQIAELNRHSAMADGSPRFFLLHRHRRWNVAQQVWMGWERKRGKLHELNHLLRAATDTSFIIDEVRANGPLPEHVRYVVTLDADTRLPRGAIKRLVGKMAHPLNRARYDAALGHVVEGYGILQPRVSSALPEGHTDSLFQRIFYSASGIDPYAFAISDVYQDLFEEGSYTGKGIYDLDVFEQAIANRIPENAILSHDLIEGIYARAGLASDIEVIEEFPSRYDVASTRQHRWARGDWQLLPWVFGRHSRDVPALGHWKMVDNLRRTVTAPFAMLALLVGWTFPLAAASLWTALIIAALAMPLLVPFVEGLIPRRGASRSSYLAILAMDASRALQRILFLIIFLPHQAWLMMDAILRTVWRVYVSHRHLLEWVTAAETKVSRQRTMIGFYKYMSGSLILTLGAALALILAQSPMWLLALPFFILWLVAPALAHLSSRIATRRDTVMLDAEDRKKFRLIGRETWRFFEHFVTASENWLPPDNFQEDPEPVIAHRTSPTNIGLYFLATATAHDFGWITIAELLRRYDDCFATLTKMERYRGHFMNWYDTQDLRPLEPRYISSVDSGNLAGYFLVIHQICRSAPQQPILSKDWINGTRDTLALMGEALSHTSAPAQDVTRRQLEQRLHDMKAILHRARSLPFNLQNSYQSLGDLSSAAAAIADLGAILLTERGENAERSDANIKQWGHELHAGLKETLRDFNQFAPWLDLFARYPDRVAELPEDILPAFMGTVPALNQVPDLCHELEQLIAIYGAQSGHSWLHAITPSLTLAAQNAHHALDQADILAQKAMSFFHDMEFRFLLDPRRKLLSIGFRVADNALDGSCYDLLASEARLASIVAIAKGDIPAHSWFRLGRTVTAIDFQPALVSWSGSMFEYLMPSLVMREPDESLIGQTNHLVVRRQIDYGNERGVPWGVSESAYNARDFEFTYQYSSFGIPGLGLKRGLSDNIVIAPYATGLAAMIEPQAALTNYARIAAMGGRGDYGWYEAIDFTPKRLPDDAKAAIVRCYMAHHQGMSLVAIQNVLLKGLMRDRFHAEPLVQATELLLQELPPRHVALAHPRSEEVEAISHIREISPIHPRCFTTPHGPTPRTHLMSNGQYAVMITAAGSGYSQWRDSVVTRWREDATRDAWGSYIYIRDTGTDRVWSATYQPTCAEPDSYNVAFLEDRAEFIRRDGALTSTLNVVVSPEDQGEVRRVSIVNSSDTPREVELTSYVELVLAPQAMDLAHPAFAKLFVETEFVADTGALLATRRPRSPSEQPIWAVHLVSIGGESVGHIQYETDRARFIGRGRSVRHPLAMDGRPLGGTLGTVLDPIFSLRCRVRLAPGLTTHIAFWTLTASSRAEALNLADKYRSPNAYNRAAARAWTQAQLQYQHLGMTPEEAHLFQRLANPVIYSDPTMRPNPQTLRKGGGAQSILWSAGISGDVPIVLMRIDVASDLKTLRQLVKAHSYWSAKRLEVDLVILNEQPTSYLENLQNEIELLVRTSQALPRAYSEGVKGKVYILRGDQISLEARGLLHSAARAVIVGHRGSLAEQLAQQEREEYIPYLSRLRRYIAKSTSQPLKRPDLEFFNGIGGFADKGREYIIWLESGQTTPAPWINVIANPGFGFHVSAEGNGYSWAINSRENKLTPWSNDPVSDETGEAIYLRDSDSWAMWTPTAAPIRRDEAVYMARHGMGYSQFETILYDIETSLTQFVPLHDPVKISVLKIRNISTSTRRLSLTSYTDWVLAPVRNAAASLVTTDIDAETRAMFAVNPWSDNFGPRTAFVHMSGKNISWTGDKREFIGRNGTLGNPAALARGKTLSGKVGAGLDSCSVLQTHLELKPGQEIDITILLGETDNMDNARALIAKYDAATATAALDDIRAYWNDIVDQVQVRTPDRAMDIMLNGWLLYQTIVCRIWARSAFYQASGAYGYRDQLQDVMTVALCKPEWTRQHLLRAAGRQFPEGDVQHWWLPSMQDAGRGVRTRFSDDALWLAYVTAYYVKTTGDQAVLDESIAFLQGPVLKDDEHEAFFMPETSAQQASLFYHCAAAIDRGLSVGAHGISLFGGGDWNDGMNRVGVKGQGESTWLAWFLMTTIRDFCAFAQQRDPQRAEKWLSHCNTLKASLEQNAWDGEWYRRGYYDDGTPLGSAASDECRIDSIAQSWAIISGAGDAEHQSRAMQSVEKYLWRLEDELALLFTPPFNHTTKDPGYIKGYPPGIRENGGQYTHAAIWSVIAYTLMGDGNKAFALYNMLNPIQHARTHASAFRYKVEPYVIAADIYGNPQHTGRGGWTWYTGSAGWMYRAGLESVLGFQVQGTHLQLHPCIPKNWPGFDITYRHRTATYQIKVENRGGLGHGVAQLYLDQHSIDPVKGIPLLDDGSRHEVLVVLGQ